MRLRPVTTGLHVVADLEEANDARVFQEALARGVEVMPLSAFCFERGAPSVNGLMLGFAAARPDLFDAGMKRLVAAIDAARPNRANRKGRAGRR